jgi:prepilin-type N-terminal cleavage/methylation domain-containing protein
VEIEGVSLCGYASMTPRRSQTFGSRSMNCNPISPHGFTLIELLVVVTIIVVLLALLTPALDKAIYRAELTMCASQLRGIGSSVTMYANESKRFYPYRGLHSRANPANNRPHYYDQPAEVKYHPAVAERPYDQRQTLKIAMPGLNKQMNDPLTEYIDIEGPAEVIFSPYNLWWGFTYYNPPGGETMLKLGESWTHDGEKYDVLAGDRDLVRPGVDVQSSHSDDVHEPGVLTQLHRQNEQGPWLIAPGGMTISCWWSSTEEIALSLTPGTRSPVDNNYVMTDLSVAMFDRVHWDKVEERGRLRTVSTYSNGWRGGEYDYMYLP